MKIVQAIQALQQIVSADPRAADVELVVAVHRPGSIGATPCVTVTQLHAGFDWDSGRVILQTEQRVTCLSTEEVDAIVTSVQKGQSWHAYQNHRRQASRVAELERELATLRHIQSNDDGRFDQAAGATTTNNNTNNLTEP